jgi:hypothetical protein
MSLKNFLNLIKNKRIKSQLEFVKNYKKVHKCNTYLMFHDQGIIIMDAVKGICILDLILIGKGGVIND